MKKLFLLVATLCLLCFGTTAFAATNGQILTKEEALTSQVMTALTGIMSYDRLSPNFAPELQQALTKDKLNEMKKDVKTKFGKMQGMKLIALQKFDQGDRVTYLANFSKQNLVRVEVFFNVSAEEPKIVSFSLTPIEVKQNQQ